MEEQILIYLRIMDFFRYARNREIVKQFNGVNYNELAIRYNMCVSNIKRILNENSV